MIEVLQNATSFPIPDPVSPALRSIRVKPTVRITSKDEGWLEAWKRWTEGKSPTDDPEWNRKGPGFQIVYFQEKE